MSSLDLLSLAAAFISFAAVAYAIIVTLHYTINSGE